MSFEIDNLIDYIDDRHVVPIVGRDLLILDLPEGPIPLYDYLAQRLSQNLGFDPAIGDLNKVAIALAQKDPRDSVHTRINRILKDEELPIPKPLQQLAEICSFPLFVTLTFDTFLEKAINAARFGGAKKTRTVDFFYDRPSDLPKDYSFDWARQDENEPPWVFQLLGKHDSNPEKYAVTEENVLELFHYLSQHCWPERLLDGLRSKHLLILGCSLPDWLTRLLLRMVTNDRLPILRDRFEYIADNGVRGGPWSDSLVYFLENFSSRTVLYREKGAVELVDELHQAWKARAARKAQGDRSTIELGGSGEGPRNGFARQAGERGTTEPEAIFLSYAREDLAAAMKIHQKLKGNIGVWFDQEKLHVGDKWKATIKSKIESCRFFMPLISQQALARDGAEFKREWNIAFKRSDVFLEDESYIMPIIVDDMKIEELPDAFTDIHVERAPGGDLSDDAVQRIVVKYRDLQIRKKKHGTRQDRA